MTDTSNHPETPEQDVHDTADTADAADPAPKPADNVESSTVAEAHTETAAAQLPESLASSTMTAVDDNDIRTPSPTPLTMTAVDDDDIRTPSPTSPPQTVDLQLVSLHAMFPDFDDAVLISVLQSARGNQERAIDTLLGMSDPDYISQEVQSPPPVPSQTDLDEQLARRLMLEEQQEHYAAQSQHLEPILYDGGYERSTRQEGGPDGRDTMSEFQEQFSRIAETGKKTIGSLISKVKAKISEFDQPRTSGQGAEPRWGSETASSHQQYEQHTHSSYYDPDDPEDTNRPLQGYDTSAPSARYTSYKPRTASSKPFTAEPADTPSSAPPPTSATTEATHTSQTGPSQPSSNIDPGKIGLLPKRPVSLLQPLPRKASEDEELEYAENPFEEGDN